MRSSSTCSGAERDKLSAVTFWGMADDDTWLDGFPVTRTDYPLPFDMGLQAKPAYWGIVDPTHLPGLWTEVRGHQQDGAARDARVWTVTATNGERRAGLRDPDHRDYAAANQRAQVHTGDYIADQVPGGAGRHRHQRLRQHADND